jgi:hypothetical protein
MTESETLQETETRRSASALFHIHVAIFTTLPVAQSNEPHPKRLDLKANGQNNNKTKNTQQ